MSRAIFQPELVYPCDGTGEYTDFEGLVVGSSENSLIVRTPWGDIEGHFSGPLKQGLPKKAVIRLYNSGGGWYPDDIITSMSWEIS